MNWPTKLICRVVLKLFMDDVDGGSRRIGFFSQSFVICVLVRSLTRFPSIDRCGVVGVVVLISMPALWSRLPRPSECAGDTTVLNPSAVEWIE